jgi:hypothetical protein
MFGANPITRTAQIQNGRRSNDRVLPINDSSVTGSQLSSSTASREAKTQRRPKSNYLFHEISLRLPILLGSPAPVLPRFVADMILSWIVIAKDNKTFLVFAYKCYCQ